MLQSKVIDWILHIHCDSRTYNIITFNFISTQLFTSITSWIALANNKESNAVFFWATRFLILIFSLFFVSGPCARLSWPSRQLLSARKSTVSYRIRRPRRRRTTYVDRPTIWWVVNRTWQQYQLPNLTTSSTLTTTGNDLRLQKIGFLLC